LLIAVWIAPAIARHFRTGCGVGKETAAETVFLHRQAVRARRAVPRAVTAAPLGNRDFGNIAVIEDSDGVVAFPNEFNLDLKTLTFTPAASDATSYGYAVSDGGYDSAAAANGMPLAALDDDDTRQVSMPFAFPFFGARYNQIFVNSDGNLTFTVGDSASTDRSLGRMTAGPPRICPLFDDLDPALTPGGVRVFADAGRMVVSWVAVPEWQAAGVGANQTFQVALYADGRIAFSYSGTAASSAVVGIAPGNQQGATSLLDYRDDPGGQYSAAVAERFGNTVQIDTVSAAWKFYQTHEDSYDYLVIYNNEDIPVAPSVLSEENTIRSSGTGYGVAPRDDGSMYGSASRLQAVLNMGMLSDYPSDPSALVPLRAPQGDTPITLLGHETGHLFLAYASVPDPDDPTAKPMLGYQNAHWSFVFNSEASFLEGERIADRGPSVEPEFLTTGTVQQYAPLDQYLMGFRVAAAVPDTFLVTGVPAYMTQWHPLRNYGFDGTRRNIAASDVVQAMGRRTPDYTVAQRRFRFAFLLVVAEGSQPSAADVAKLEVFRQQFESLYATASSGNGTADTALERSMKLSLYPAAGVAPDAAITATLTLETAPAADLAVQLQAPNGFAALPASVRIPAGAKSATFGVTAVKPGVEEVSAVPADASYETAVARVQVADASILKLAGVSGDHQVSTSAAPLPDPIVVRLTDSNSLSYPGARILATASDGGSVAPAAAVTDQRGQAAFRWTPGPASANQLQLALEGSPTVNLTMTALMTPSGVPVTTTVNVGAGDYIEIYCTGLGPTQLSAGLQQTVLTPVVFIGAVPLQPIYSGLVSGVEGLYQLDVQVPGGLAPGVQPVLLSVSMAHSNQVSIMVQ